MAYGGYLIKLGTGNSAYEIPLSCIKADTYTCVWSVVDFDSYRDANGQLHRDAVSDRRIMKVEFETPDMSDTELSSLLSSIKSKFSDSKSKTVKVTAWMPEEGAYKSDTCYLTSDVNISIRFANSSMIRYNPVRLAFIGYGTSNAT